MPADAHQVNFGPGNLERQFSERLYPIAVDQRLGVFRADELRGPLDRESRAGLVVDHHHADQGGFPINRISDRLRVNPTRWAGPHPGHRPAGLLQTLHRCGDRRMLRGRGDQLSAAADFGVCRAENRQIVGFTAARGETDTFALTPQQPGGSFPRLRQLPRGTGTHPMQGGRVPIALPHHPQGSVCRRITDPGSRGVVKIGFHWLIVPLTAFRRFLFSNSLQRARAPSGVYRTYYTTKFAVFQLGAGINISRSGWKTR